MDVGKVKMAIGVLGVILALMVTKKGQSAHEKMVGRDRAVVRRELRVSNDAEVVAEFVKIEAVVFQWSTSRCLG